MSPDPQWVREAELAHRQWAWRKGERAESELAADMRTCDWTGNVTGEDDQAFFEGHGMGD